MEGTFYVEKEVGECVLAAVWERSVLATCVAEQAQPWLAERVQITRLFVEKGSWSLAV